MFMKVIKSKYWSSIAIAVVCSVSASSLKQAISDETFAKIEVESRRAAATTARRPQVNTLGELGAKPFVIEKDLNSPPKQLATGVFMSTARAEPLD